MIGDIDDIQDSAELIQNDLNALIALAELLRLIDPDADGIFNHTDRESLEGLYRLIEMWVELQDERLKKIIDMDMNSFERELRRIELKLEPLSDACKERGEIQNILQGVEKTLENYNRTVKDLRSRVDKL